MTISGMPENSLFEQNGDERTVQENVIRSVIRIAENSKSHQNDTSYHLYAKLDSGDSRSEVGS